MSVKTIIYVGGFIFPDGNAAAHRVLSNAKIFRDLKYEVLLIGITKIDSTKDILSSKKSFSGFDYYEIPYPKKKKDWIKYLTSITDVKRIIQLLRKDDIFAVIAYNYPSIALYNLSVFCAKINIKLISDITEWYGGSGKGIIFKGIKKLDNYLRFNITKTKSQGVICISSFLEEYFYKGTTLLLPPLVDIKEPKWPIDIPLLKRIKQFSYVGSSGSTSEKETFDYLFESFSLLSDEYNFILNIVGVTKDEILKNSPQLKEFIRKLDTKLIFLGKLSNKESIDIINRSHFFIFLRQETMVTKAGFPTKFVESITAGTPVLTNKTSDIEYYLENGKNGFWLNIEDSKQLKGTLQRCLNMPNKEIIKMKKYCYESHIFDFTKFKDRMCDFLNRIQLK